MTVKRFFQFFYTFPTRYMNDIPQDRQMIWPNTAMGSVFGAAWQGLALGFAYGLYKSEPINEGDLMTIGALSAIPFATNILSGIYEWKNPREGYYEHLEMERESEEIMKKRLEDIN